VLDEIKNIQAAAHTAAAQTPPEEISGKISAATILNELQPLLEKHHTDSLKYEAELKKIPAAAPLAKKINDFEFDAALVLLHELRGKLDAWDK
jgi:hypothetical protein